MSLAFHHKTSMLVYNYFYLQRMNKFLLNNTILSFGNFKCTLENNKNLQHNSIFIPIIV